MAPRFARLAVVLVGIAGLLASATAASAAQRVITSAGPLTSIYVNDDLGCSVDRNDETQVFGGTDPGSCGTFLAAAGEIYGPAGVGPTTEALTPVSQTNVTGSEVETVADAGATGLQIKQTDSYLVDDEFYTTTVEVSNSGGSDQAVTLYHAADCYLRGDDTGYGHEEAGAIYCSRGPDDASSGLFGFEPTTLGSKYLEGFYSSVFGAIDGTGFLSTCDCLLLQDNGAGISWSFDVPANDFATHSFRTRVSADTNPPNTFVTPEPASPGDDTRTFSLETNEPSATFKCSVDSPDPPSAPCTSPHTTAPLGPGPHVFRVMATDPDGNSDPTPATASFTIDATPLVAGSGTGVGSGGALGQAVLPPPIRSKTANIGRVSGKVLVRRRGSSKFVELTDEAAIPVGSTVDTRKGRAQVTVTIEGGKTQSAQFYDGVFNVLQKTAKRPVAEMRLAGKLENCTSKAKRSSDAATAARKRKGRRLWGKGKGRFRTRGRYGAATVRGTTWLVEDRCDKSTLTRVTAGRVTVRDFAKHKNVTVTKGRRYVARAKTRRR